MLNAEKGHVIVTGSKIDIIFEYAAITNTFYRDVLGSNKDAFMKAIEMGLKLKQDDETEV